MLPYLYLNKINTQTRMFHLFHFDTTLHQEIIYALNYFTEPIRRDAHLTRKIWRPRKLGVFRVSKCRHPDLNTRKIPDGAFISSVACSRLTVATKPSYSEPKKEKNSEKPKKSRSEVWIVSRAEIRKQSTMLYTKIRHHLNCNHAYPIISRQFHSHDTKRFGKGGAVI